MNRHILSVMTSSCFCLVLSSGCKEATQMQTEIIESGRLISIARAPNRTNEFLAAAETGGLFRSVDGGLHWTNVSGLPSFDIADVAYAPNDPQTILVTFRRDFRVGPKSGRVWRSVDGGRLWSQAPLTLQESGTCAPQMSAFGISFDPGSQDVYVGTSCGLALSHDRGATWALLPWIDPYHVFAFGVNSVLVQPGGGVFAVADDGDVAARDPISGTWSKLTGVTGGGTAYAIHAIAVSPVNSKSIYIYGNQLQASEDGGLTWTALPGSAFSGNREPFVVTAPKAKWGSGYELYAGNGTQLLRYRVLDTAQGPVLLNRAQVTVQHSDPTDMLYDLDGVSPKFATGDGGLLYTTNLGDEWTLVAGPSWGLNALQIYEITGQAVQSGNNTEKDLYFGTQDNYFWASSTNGAGWTKSICCEGSDFQSDLVVSPANAKLVFVDCQPCRNRISNALYGFVPSWNDAPPLEMNETVDTPIRLQAGTFMQNVHAASGFTNAYRLTTDWGNSWLPGAAFLTNEQVTGRPVVVQEGSQQGIYQAIQTGFNWGTSQPVYSLVKRTYPGFTELHLVGGGLVSLALDQSREVQHSVYAVNPQNPSQQMALDSGDGTVKFSKDGGETWNPDNKLTSMIEGNGQYRITAPYDGSLIAVIAWDPDAPCHVLIGAKQGGMYETTNGGGLWAPVSSNSPIPAITSIYFPVSGRVIASTFGGGLWNVDSSRSPRSCTFYPVNSPSPRSSMRLVNPASGVTLRAGSPLGFPAQCQQCRIIVAQNGEIGDVEVNGDRLLDFALRRGQAFEFDRSGKEFPLDIPNLDPKQIDRRRLLSIPGRGTQDNVKALVIDGDRLVAVVQTQQEFPFLPAREPKTLITGKLALGGVISAVPGEQVAVQGQGFAPSVTVSISLQAQGQPPVLLSSRTDAKGSFRLPILASGLPGQRLLVTSQQDGKRLVKTISIFSVLKPADADSH